MTRDELLDLFRRSGALLEGHFRLTSGLHSPGYLQCALVLQHPQHAEALGRAIADRVARSAADGRAVAGARRRRHRPRGRPRARRARDLRRAAGRRARRCGAASRSTRSDRVLVVEDVVTTGGSTRETIEVATAAGGQVVGAASIVESQRRPRCRSTCRSCRCSRSSCRPTSPTRARSARRDCPVVKPGSRAGRGLTSQKSSCTSRQFSVPAIRNADVQDHARLRRHRLRRLAAAGQRRLDPGAARRRAARARRPRRDGAPARAAPTPASTRSARSPRSRSRASSSAGRRRPRAQRASAARHPRARRRGGAAGVSRALRRARRRPIAIASGTARC